MKGARRLVALLTVAWLSCQVATPIVSLTLFAALSRTHVAASLACQCPHGAETGICPMHQTPAESTPCRLRRADDGATVALVALSSLLGLTTESVSVIRSAPASTQLLASRVPTLDRAVLPDRPPPRA
jgi:hypothetical protein